MFFESVYIRAAGIVVLLAGVFALFSKTGYEVDVPNHRYRDYTRLGFFRFGGWRPLPEVDYIAIVRVKLSQLAFGPSELTFRQDSGKSSLAFQVNLILKKEERNRVIKLYTGNLDNAMQYTTELARLFQKPIYDCRTDDKKWLNV